MSPQRVELPIDALLPDIVGSLRTHAACVVEAAPGAGKTTRVPAALLEAFGDQGEVLVLEPRRLATRLSAARVATELNEKLGERVGYSVRQDDVSSAKTRLRFVTEGILTRRLVRDPWLAGVRVVVLDEFHERHLHTDLALSWLAKVQQKRQDLALVVMSATLDADPVVDFLSGAARASSQGRAFPVTIEHQKGPDERPLHGQVVSALRGLLQQGLDGDVLVFLPGMSEIRRAMDAASTLASEHQLLLVPLHGALSADEQDRAVRKADRRKIVFATNVAETSVTIDGVVAVIDSGLARVAEHASWSGLPMLKLARVAQAACVQRAGRAGRTRPGRCIRLFTSQDFATRPKFETPEIRRADLADLALTLAQLPGGKELSWFESPRQEALQTANALLVRLGFLSRDTYNLQDEGKLASQLPIHPRLAKLMIEASKRGHASIGCRAAALLSERGVDAAKRADEVEHSDVWIALEQWRRQERDPRYAALSRTADQLQKALSRLLPSSSTNTASDSPALALQHAVHAGFVDRVARVRRAQATGKAEVVFAAGGSARLSDSSVCMQSDFVVAVEVEERIEAGRSVTTVQRASEIEPAWVFERSFDDLEEDEEVAVNERNRRVEKVRRLRLGQLVLEETRSEPDSNDMAAVLQDAAEKRGLAALVGKEHYEPWLMRLAYLRRVAPELELPEITERDLVRSWAKFATSLKDFGVVSADFVLSETYGGELVHKLNTMAPERIALPHGRKLSVTYSEQAPPWVESRLQDFFGLREVPRIAGGRDAIVLHLLAPNGRDVQVTTDLAGFWSRHYPAIAQELRRRYPRHSWPDDPLTATPPEPRPPRRR